MLQRYSIKTVRSHRTTINRSSQSNTCHNDTCFLSSLTPNAMASVAYDVLVEILEWLIEPEPDEISRLDALWPSEVLCDLPLLRSSRAQIHLRACCLVCRWWRIVAQPILQEHLCWNSREGKTAVENLLRIDGVASRVTSIEARKWYCGSCDPIEPCPCSISIETLVTTLATYPRLTRLVVDRWSGLHVAPFIPPTPIRTFPQLTTLRIGSSFVPIRFRSFCLILQLMPALHTPAIGDFRNASSDTIDDIPYPPCQLRSFTVSDGHSVEFHSYDWLLHNSKSSLQILRTYSISPDAIEFLIRALPHIGPSLREFRCLGCWDSQVALSALQHCHKLEALACCHSPNILDNLANAACAKTLLRFNATKLELIGSDEADRFIGDFGERFMEFWSAEELVAMRQAVQSRILPQLKEWKLQTWEKGPLVGVPKDELIALKNECDRHGVVFDFARYDEVINGRRQETRRPDWNVDACNWI